MDFQLWINYCDLILNFKVHTKEFWTHPYKARTISSLDAIVMNHFIFLVILEELLDATM
jgi:hypothetical protein